MSNLPTSRSALDGVDTVIVATPDIQGRLVGLIRTY